MIDDKQRLETYRAALVEAIVTIDHKTYGKWNKDWSRLRRIIDMVLNHDRPIERAIYVAEEEVKEHQAWFDKVKQFENKEAVQFPFWVSRGLPAGLPVVTSRYDITYFIFIFSYGLYYWGFNYFLKKK